MLGALGRVIRADGRVLGAHGRVLGANGRVLGAYSLVLGADGRALWRLDPLNIQIILWSVFLIACE